MSQIYRVLIACGLSLSSFGEQVFALSANDISVLIPINYAGDHPHLLRPQDQGRNGELLPESIFNALPHLVEDMNQRNLYEKNIRVVGIRLDPCFSEGENPLDCRRQIRLVWQPIVSQGHRGSTADAALHTFHEFDRYNWGQLLAQWSDLASGFPDDALQVHPILKKQGLRGEYWQRLRSIILENCGPENLIRITAMTVRGRGRIWDFMGWNIAAGQMQPIQIATIGSAIQVFSVNLRQLDEFQGNIQPASQADDSFLPLVRDSRRALNQLPESTQKAIARKAVALENPELHNPGTADCVSCHIAQTVRLWNESHFPNWRESGEFELEQFWSSRNTTNTSTKPSHVNRLRGFGYFNDEAAISQRVINETVSILEHLSQF